MPVDRALRYSYAERTFTMEIPCLSGLSRFSSRFSDIQALPKDKSRLEGLSAFNGSWTQSWSTSKE